MMTRSIEEFTVHVSTKYPAPIATAWRHVSRSSAKKEEHDRIIDLYEISSLTLAAILISQYLSENVIDGKINGVLAKLPLASFGTWVDALELLLSRYSKEASASIGRSFSAELGRKSSYPNQKKAMREIAQLTGQNEPSTEGKHTIISFLRWVVSYRNELAHSKPSPSEDMCDARLEWLRPATFEFLESLAFLVKYPLIYINEVHKEDNEDNYMVRTAMGWDLDRRVSHLGGPNSAKKRRLYLFSQEESHHLLILPLLYYDICKKCNYEPRVFLFRKALIQNDDKGGRNCKELDFTCPICGGHSRVSDETLTQEFLETIGVKVIDTTVHPATKSDKKDEIPEQTISNYFNTLQEIYSKYYKSRYIQPQMRAIQVEWNSEDASTNTRDTLLQDLYFLTNHGIPAEIEKEIDVSSELHDLITYAQEFRSFVLLGESGCGKSSALLWLLSNWQDKSKIPLFVSLNRYENGSVEEFLTKSWCPSICSIMRPEQTDETNLELQTSTIAPHTYQLMSDGRLVILLDGLNELPTDDNYARRLNQLRDYLEKAKSKGNIVIISCRKNDYAEQFPHSSKIEIFPLDDARIRSILNSYLGQNKGAEIWTALEQLGNSRLRELVRNPFMLVAFIAICTTQGGDFPSERSTLFNMLSSMSISRELQKNQFQLTQPREVVDKMSAAIAFTMTLSGRVNANKNELSKRLPEAWFFDPRRTVSPIDAVLAVLKSARLIEQMRSQEGETLAFTHQLWQEYYSAKLISGFDNPEIRGLICYILKVPSLESPFEIIRPHLHKTKWKNTITMLSSLLPQSLASDLVNDISKANSEFENLLYRDSLLASACICESAINIYPNTIEAIQNKLSTAQDVGISTLKSAAEQAQVSIMSAIDQGDGLFAYAIDKQRSWDARYLAVQSLEKLQLLEKTELAWLSMAIDEDLDKNIRVALAKSFETKGFRVVARKTWEALSRDGRVGKNIHKEARKAMKRLGS